MPIYAVSIEKRIPYRGDIQSFHNVYHFDVGQTLGEGSRAIIDPLTAFERNVHSTQVQFKNARMWQIGATQADTRMLTTIEDLAVAGHRAIDETFPREAAFLCYWHLGRYGKKNRPQFLRKWIHSMTLLGANSNIISGTHEILTVPPDLRSYMDAIRELTLTGASGVGYLCTRSGRRPVRAGELYRWMEHHQLGK